MSTTCINKNCPVRKGLVLSVAQPQLHNERNSLSLFSDLLPPLQVRPVNGRDWTEEAVDWFKAMVHGRTLYARLYPQGLAVSVELFLERGKLGAMRYIIMNHSVINAFLET